jgi:predicted O-methyltransferase YrrM
MIEYIIRNNYATFFLIEYNEWLMNNEAYTTNFLNIDDGLAISIKGESK